MAIKERDEAITQVAIERQNAEKARAEVEMERKKSTRAKAEAERVHAFSAAAATEAERATEHARKKEEKALAEAQEAQLQLNIVQRERDAAVEQAGQEHEAYEQARSEAEAAELEQGLRRLEDTPLQVVAHASNWADVLQEKAVQATQAAAGFQIEDAAQMANIATKPESEEVPVMHHAGRWKLATKGAGGYGWIAASQAKETSFEEERRTPQGSTGQLEVPVTHRTGRWMAASAPSIDDQQTERAALKELSGGLREVSTHAGAVAKDDHVAVHGGLSVARAAKASQQSAEMTVVPEKVLHAAASKLDDILVTNLQDILATKVNLKLDAMLDRKLDVILGVESSAMRLPASKASTNLLALQPAPQTDPAERFSTWVALASKEALRDPAFTAEHKRRQTFVGVRLDGKHIFSQPAHEGRTTYTSEWAKDIGLKVTAVETREHKIGNDMSVRVDVQTDKMNFRIWSSKADMFHNDSKMQVKYAHLNLNLLGPFPTRVGGFFAELRGKRPMSKRSKSFLRKEDRREQGRTVMGNKQ